MQNGELLETIILLFESLGYKVQYKILNAVDFGVPQLRERIIIIGSKLKNNFQYPEPTHFNMEEPTDLFKLFKKNLKPYLMLEEAISDLPFIRSGEERFEYATDPKNDFQELMRRNAPKILIETANITIHKLLWDTT